MEPNQAYYDVIIIGCGPGGSSCALTLKNSGLKVLLIDKEQFPRDKICGDAIPSRAIKVLHQIAPNQGKAFRNFTYQSPTQYSRIFINDNRSIQVKWQNEAYTSPRLHFDNFLFEAVQNETNFDVVEGIRIDDIQKLDNKFTIGHKKSGRYFQGKVLVGADGAQSVVARQLMNFKVSLEDHVGAVRAYYKNVNNLPVNSTEFYIHQKYPNCYLWVFPVGNDVANVGLGMLSSKISERKIKLRLLLDEWVNNSKVLQNRLEHAERLDKIKGFSLPLGTRRVPMVGNHFLLIGDAASLIDPIGGHGIDTAMLSGQLAGQRIIEAFQKNDFSEAFLKKYERQLFDIIGEDFQKKTRFLRWSGKYPWLSTQLIKLGSYFY